MTEQEYFDQVEALAWVDPNTDKEGWQRWYDARKALAQQLTNYLFDGTLVPRIRYGALHDRMPPEDGVLPCHDCAVAVGELHLPGCDAEACPMCFRQAISCGCNMDEDEDEDTEEEEQV